MNMWDFLPASAFIEPWNGRGGARVARLGTVSFVRSGFARVRWDDGRLTDEWLTDLVVAGEYPRKDRG